MRAGEACSAAFRGRMSSGGGRDESCESGRGRGPGRHFPRGPDGRFGGRPGGGRSCGSQPDPRGGLRKRAQRDGDPSGGDPRPPGPGDPGPPRLDPRGRRQPQWRTGRGDGCPDPGCRGRADPVRHRRCAPERPLRRRRGLRRRQPFGGRHFPDRDPAGGPVRRLGRPGHGGRGQPGDPSSADGRTHRRGRGRGRRPGNHLPARRRRRRGRGPGLAARGGFLRHRRYLSSP